MVPGFTQHSTVKLLAPRLRAVLVSATVLAFARPPPKRPVCACDWLTPLPPMTLPPPAPLPVSSGCHKTTPPEPPASLTKGCWSTTVSDGAKTCPPATATAKLKAPTGTPAGTVRRQLSCVELEETTVT